MFHKRRKTMDKIKKIWPTPFKIEAKNFTSFLIQLIIFVVICAVAGLLINVLNAIPVLNIFTWIIGLALEIYSIVGIVLCFLKFFEKV